MRYKLEIQFATHYEGRRILRALGRERDRNIGVIGSKIVIVHNVFDTHIVDLQKMIESKAIELGIWNEESLRDRRKPDKQESEINQELRESRTPVSRPRGDS